MSITLTATILINDFEVLKETVEELGYSMIEEPIEVALYKTVEYGYPVYLPSWKYPVVITEEGQIRYDNYNGMFGDQEYLDTLLQTYLEKKITKDIKTQAELSGYNIQMEDNIIKLTKGNETIEIQINKQHIIIDAKGFIGQKCKEEVNKILNNLIIESQTLKQELY